MKRNANLLATFQYLKSLLEGGERQHKRTLVLALVLVELLLIIGAYISYNNKNLDKYIFGKSTSSSNLFAVMIEDSNGNYQQSTDNNFPGYEYFYNQTKSGCMSSSGKQIEDSLLYDQDKKKATVKVSETIMCYLYFDKYKTTTFADQLIDSGNLWQSGLEGDGYRYVGSGAVGTDTNPDNFICFGTIDKTKCTEEPKKYMYRVIGVFVDENGTNHVKLIKYTSSGAYQWNTSSYDISWGYSSLFKGLNGNYFLTNTAFDYLQDTTWINKIENWTWSAVNTKTMDGSGGPNYFSITTQQIYLHEMNRSTKENNVGSWNRSTSKIGLIYASDYALSLGSSSLELTTGTSTNKDLFKTGWMHPSNNMGTEQWTIARVGDMGSYHGAWKINSGGSFEPMNIYKQSTIRPAFYLTNEVKVSSGEGSLENPFIIDTSSSTMLLVTIAASGATLTATITKGTGNLNKYCINNNATINDCEWKNINSTTITYEMPEDGTYYIHVIDDAGFIAHSSYTYITWKWDNNLTLQENIIKYENLWQSGLEGDGYRYVGSGTPNESTNPNNFICFGTTDKIDCTANQDKYMYRIIGVFTDSNGKNHVKLIKYKQLISTTWNSTNADVNWEDSTLYASLNGSGFLTNTTYDYLQDTTWNNRIENWTWSAVNTKTYSNSGPNYYSITTQQIYLHEMNRTGKSSTVGEWTNPVAKIGLMYASDYQMSLGSSALALTGNTSANQATLKTGWMHQSNNDTTKSSYEWTLSRAGANSGDFVAWNVYSYGYVGTYRVHAARGSRPVFYLTSDVTSSGGTGTLEDPIMIN